MAAGARAGLEPAEFDVLVAGAGPGGSAAAARLAARGLRVLLTEASDFGARRIGEHLPPEARPLLQTLGVWGAPIDGCSRRSLGIDARWASDHVQRHDYAFNPQGTGRQLDRVAFDRALALAARDAGATLLTGTCVRALGRAGDGRWTVTLQRSDKRASTTCRFVVDATGRMSRLARLLGVRRERLDRAVALAVWSSPDARALSSSDQAAFLQVEAAQEGWWYFGALPNDDVVAVLITDADLMRSDDGSRPGWSSWWMACANRVPRLRALLASAPGPVGYSAHAAGSSRLERSAGEAWVAVGDASLALDPLASRGIVDALDSGVRAASAITDALGGDGAGLARYASVAEQRFTQYMRERAAVYADVTRWTDQPFWARRRIAG